MTTDALKILMLEDSTADAEMIQRLLQKERDKYAFKLVMDEAAYLHALDEYKPDIILSDNAMPQFTASEALRLLRQRDLQIPFILVTGTVSEEFAAGIIKAGADDYLLKDRLTRLPAAIEAALRQKQVEKEHTEATQLLKQSEEKYRTLIEQASDGIFIANMTGKCIEVNEIACRVTGYSKEEFIDLDLHDLMVLGNDSVPLRLNDINLEKPIIQQRTIRRKDGTTFPVEISAKLMQDGHYFASVRDLSERIEAEQKLAESEKRFRALIENSNDAILLLDESLKIIYQSQAAARITGWNNEKFDNKTATEKVHTDYIGLFKAKFSESLSKPEIPVPYLVKYLHASGNNIWAEGTFTNLLHVTEVHAVIVNYRDVTQRKETEDKLTASEKQFRQSMDNMLEGVQIIGFDWRYIYLNNMAAEQGRYKKEELLGHTMLEKYPGIEQTKLFKVCQRCFDERVPIQFENEFEFPDKTRGCFQLSIQPVPEGIFILSVDITEQKKAETILSEEKEKFTKIAATSPGLIYSMHQDKDGILSYPYASEAITDIYGFCFDEIKNNPDKIFSLIHKDDVGQVIKSIKTTKKELVPLKGEYRYQHPAKGLVWHEVNSLPALEPNGAVVCHGIVIDITERKKAEEALKEERDKIAHIAATAPGLLYSFQQQQDGSFCMPYASNALEDIFGFKHEAVAGDAGKILNLCHADDKERLLKSLQTALADITEWKEEFRYMHPVKGEVWLHGHSIPMKDSPGLNKWHGIVTDITEAKRTEAALLEERDKFSKIAAAAPGLIYSFRLQVDGSFSFPYASAAIEDMFGFSLKEVRNNVEKIVERGSTDEVTAFFNSISQSAKTLEPWIYEFQYNHPVKGDIWLYGHSIPAKEADGSTLWHGIITDVTERKKAAGLIIANEKRFRKLVENGNDAFVIVDSTGKPAYASSSVERVIGYTEEEVKKMDMFSLVHPDNIEDVQQTFAKVMANPGVPVTSHISRLKHKDGTWHYYEDTITNLMDDPDIGGIVDNFRDVTERIKAEEAVRESEETFSKIFYLNPSVCAINDLQDDKFIDVNEAFIHYFGFSKEEVIGKTSEELGIMRPETRSDIINKMDDQGIIHNLETTVITKSGEKKDILLSTSNIYIRDKEYAFTISIDITERKKAEEAIRANEEKYRVLVEEASEGIFISDTSGKFITVNASACRIAQYTEEELLQMSMYDFFTDDDLAERPLKLDALKEGKTVIMERVMKRKDGQLNYLEITSKLLTDGRLLSLVRDMAERKKTQEALVASEEKYRTLVEQATDGIFIADQHGKFLMVNSSGCNISGYSTEELKKLSIYDLVHPEDLKANPFHFEEMRQAKGARAERKLLCKDGTVLDVEINAKFLSDKRFIAFVSDISERKKAEQSIILSNERYDMVSKATNDSIWDLNIITGVITRTGNGFKTLFGYEQDQNSTESLHWTKLVHPDDLLRVMQSQDVIFNNDNEFYWEQEYRFLKVNGEYAYVYDKGFIIRDVDGRAIRMIGATQDITKLREHEKHLISLNKSLQVQAKELADSYAELEQFAYVASHDLQEPLRMVTSFLLLLEKNFDDHLDSKAKQYINFAVDGAKRMRQIILDLLELSRVGRKEGDKEMLELHKVIMEIQLLFVKEIEERNVIIDLDAGERLVINTYRSPLLQVFQNLVGNAIKYKKEAIPAQIKISATSLPDYWQFSVADNGIGIENEYFDRIFVVFQRLHNKNEFSGTGIGLSITKKIIESLGGKIWLESEPGKGTTFYFTIKK